MPRAKEPEPRNPLLQELYRAVKNVGKEIRNKDDRDTFKDAARAWYGAAENRDIALDSLAGIQRRRAEPSRDYDRHSSQVRDCFKAARQTADAEARGLGRLRNRMSEYQSTQKGTEAINPLSKWTEDSERRRVQLRLEWHDWNSREAVEVAADIIKRLERKKAKLMKEADELSKAVETSRSEDRISLYICGVLLRKAHSAERLEALEARAEVQSLAKRDEDEIARIKQQDNADTLTRGLGDFHLFGSSAAPWVPRLTTRIRDMLARYEDLLDVPSDRIASDPNRQLLIDYWCREDHLIENRYVRVLLESLRAEEETIKRTIAELSDLRTGLSIGKHDARTRLRGNILSLISAVETIDRSLFQRDQGFTQQVRVPDGSSRVQAAQYSDAVTTASCGDLLDIGKSVQEIFRGRKHGYMVGQSEREALRESLAPSCESMAVSLQTASERAERHGFNARSSGRDTRIDKQWNQKRELGSGRRIEGSSQSSKATRNTRGIRSRVAP